MSGNKRAKTNVDHPSMERFEELNQVQGKILKWNQLEQGGENIYHVRRYYENPKSLFATRSIILELEKKNEPICKVYCSGEVAKEVCYKWDAMDKGQNMFLRSNGTATTEAGHMCNLVDVVIQ